MKITCRKIKIRKYLGMFRDDFVFTVVNKKKRSKEAE